MKLNCDQATSICDKNQYDGESTVWSKIKLSWHVLFCKKCGVYSEQNSLMTKCYEKQNSNGIEKLTVIEKEDMDEKMKEKII